MKAAILSVGALAIGASAWSWPECEADNCYREMVDQRFYDESKSFCPGYLAGTTYDIPSDYENCDGDASKVSSACSCITYTPTTSSSTYAPTTTTYPPTTTTTPYQTYSSSSSKTYPVYSSSSSPYYPVYTSSTPAYPYPTAPVSYTTSTLYTTTCYTVTSCDMPGCSTGYYTTQTVPYKTTVCPVYSTTSVQTYAAPTYPASSASPTYVVTAGAGKAASGFGLAAAGAIAAALL